MTQHKQYIRFLQTKNADGESAQSEYVQEIFYEGLRSVAESAFDNLKHLRPRETDHPGIFQYVDSKRGSGTFRIEHFNPLDADKLRQLLRMQEISDAIGKKDPHRSEELSFGASVVPRTSNPFFQITLGVVSIGISAWGIAIMVNSFDGTVGYYFAFGVLVALCLFGILILWVGAKRVRWWTAMRAEVRRRGVAMPEQLRFWN